MSVVRLLSVELQQLKKTTRGCKANCLTVIE